MINILCFYLNFIQYFYISSLLFEYSIRALESLKCFKPSFSHFLINNWYFVLDLSNAFVFPDLEPPIINILYG